MKLIPYRGGDPFTRMQRVMDRMFDLFDGDTRRLWEWDAGDGQNWLALDVRETDKEIVVETALPGVEAGDVDLKVEGNRLTISAESRHERDEQEQGYHLRELRYGKFSRSVELPAGVKPDQTEAILSDGILTIRLPRSEASTVKRITVKPRKLIKG